MRRCKSTLGTVWNCLFNAKQCDSLQCLRLALLIVYLLTELVSAVASLRASLPSRCLAERRVAKPLPCKDCPSFAFASLVNAKRFRRYAVRC
jgi:hypothetical protein